MLGQSTRRTQSRPYNRNRELRERTRMQGNAVRPREAGPLQPLLPPFHGAFADDEFAPGILLDEEESAGQVVAGAEG